MKKYILFLLVLICVIAAFFLFRTSPRPSFGRPWSAQKASGLANPALQACQDNLAKYLKSRQDELALAQINKIISIDPADLCALWARAELLRRGRRFKESEMLLKQLLDCSPDYACGLITLAYIRYYYNEFDEALNMLLRVLKQPNLSNENKALAFMLIGSVNAKRSSRGWTLPRIIYGLKVKGFFEKARALAPDLAEVHLGLGSFYLLAPAVVGGDINKAIEELRCAINLAPDFATANARLAQAYKRKGNTEKYNFYLRRAQELDPGNEVLIEMADN
jgi:tetratricopeptide (TPR) repeat protein